MGNKFRETELIDRVINASDVTLEFIVRASLFRRG